jgi:hypothetical protein
MTETLITTMPVNFPLHPIMPGADWGWAVKIKDDNREAIDTTDWTARMEIRETYGGELIIALETGSGIINTAAEGLFSIDLTGAQTSDFLARQVVYDLFITDDSGGVTCPFRGPIDILDRVTEPEVTP